MTIFFIKRTIYSIGLDILPFANYLCRMNFRHLETYLILIKRKKKEKINMFDNMIY